MKHQTIKRLSCKKKKNQGVKLKDGGTSYWLGLTYKIYNPCNEHDYNELT